MLTIPKNAPLAFHLLANLLRQGSYADEIMALYAAQEKAQFAGVGRNDPCPCGSGKKFKQCHGRKAVTPAASL